MSSMLITGNINTPFCIDTHPVLLADKTQSEFTNFASTNKVELYHFPGK